MIHSAASATVLRPSAFLPRIARITVLLVVAGTGCIPYTVGSTAQTVPTGQTTSATSWYVIPNAFSSPDDSTAAPMYGVDAELRHGLSPRSDVGLRFVPGGVVMNYKNRFTSAAPGRPAAAYKLGTGFVNSGEHLHLEGTLIASGDERSPVVPFGGLRGMQVVPITKGAVRDSPTIGVFAGLQVGDAAFTLRPELGVYHDRSALGVRRSTFIFVPAVTLQRRRD